MAVDHWPSKALGEISTWLSGGTPSKSEPMFWGGSIPWISASSMKTLRLSDSEERITEAGLESGSRLAPADTVLLLVRGSELHKSIPIGITSRPVAFNQDVKALIPKAGVSPDFLLYWLLAHRDLLLSKVEHTGIGAGKLDMQVMLRLPVQLPPPSEQELITSFMKSIDDKIELNRRMNKTLEAIARAIFKSWFVNFDPVRARTDEKQPSGGRAELLDLFPNSLRNGLPTEWRWRPISAICQINSRQLRDAAPNYELEYIDISSAKRGRILETQLFRYENAPSRARRLVQDGDTVMSTVRPGNRAYFFVVNPSSNLIVSTGYAVLTPKANARALTYLGMTSDETIDQLDRIADGGAYPAVRPEQVGAVEILWPGDKIAGAFEKIVSPILLRIAANDRESGTLTAIRDTLLPKLISGKIRINRSERLVGARA